MKALYDVESQSTIVEKRVSDRSSSRNYIDHHLQSSARMTWTFSEKKQHHERT